jgi:integrase
VDGRRRFYRIGTYPDTGLAAARERAGDVRELVDAGLDPRDHDEQQRRAALEQAREESRQGTVEQLFQSYIASMQERGKTSWQEVERALWKNALPVLGATTRARDVTAGGIRDVLHGVLKRGTQSKTGNKVHANRVRSYLFSAFRHGIHHDHDPAKLGADFLFGLETNPVDAVPRNPDVESEGDRDLEWDELGTLWHSTVPNPLVRAYFRLALALGGQRVKELVAARWAEFDLEARVWTIPPERTKNRKYHLVPITDLAMEALGELPGTSPALFPSGRAAHMSPFTIRDNIVRLREREGMVPWVARDLRRTVKTRMGEIGIPKWIRDHIQNHAKVDVSSKHYDRYDYLAEKRDALETWERALRERVINADERSGEVNSWEEG